MKKIIWAINIIGFVAGIKMPLKMTDMPLVPNKCHMTNSMFKECCVFPPFFTRDVARECGAKLTVSEVLNDADVVTIKRHMFDKCEFWGCVLKKYDLLSIDGLVDDENYYSHLDRWVNLNPRFAEVMKKAKSHCKLYFKMYIPLKQCEFYQFQLCIRNFVNLDCPAVVPTPECENLKKFHEECREYYL